MQEEPEQFDDEQAMLLLYLMDELPAAERVAMERRLAGDAKLRQQLDELRAAHHATWRALEQADKAVHPVAVPRGIQTAIRQWTTRKLVQQGAPVRSRSSWRWAGPSLAAAAAVLIGIFIWQSAPSNPSAPASNQPPRTAAADPAPAETPRIAVAEPEPEIEQAVVAIQDDLWRGAAALEQAEAELNELSYMQQTLVQ